MSFLQSKWKTAFYVLVSCCFCYGYYLHYKFEHAEKAEVVGTITVVKHKKRDNIEAEYSVGDRRYMETRSDRVIARNLEPGEKFMISYIIDDPADSEILLNKPYVDGHDSIYVRTSSTSNKYGWQLTGDGLVIHRKSDPEIAYICVDSVNCWYGLAK